jgi:hypothetical protein
MYSMWSLLMLCGCGLMIDKAISRHHEVAGQISLGDSKQKVLSVLQPIENDIPSAARRTSEAFLVADSQGKEHRIEIYYFRSARYADEMLTDDEFTPYVFKDGYLVAIGWAYLGGPKTVFRPEPDQKREETRCRPDYMGGFSCTTTDN